MQKVVHHVVAKVSNCTHLKVLVAKQILLRLSKAHTKRRAGNTSKKLINEIRQIMNSLYLAKEVTENAYNNIIN